ncbi:MAG: TonB-dependent receptor [Bacteroidetes bacterium]|nr:TonB-dependent receptor [Bacteroidota bacterium]MCX7907213.1 TonB-dependent receptor [Bacteroidota bacterium]MDW8138716.1 TonB-dependent receptor [Bacteroidota bacterium]
MVALLFWFLVPVWAWAQTTTVVLEGRVYGAEGRPLPNAEVLVVHKETGQQRGAVTDSEGRYRILGLAPGLYDVMARHLGYRTETRLDVQLVLGQRAVLDFSLRPEAVQVGQVEVVGQRVGSFEVRRVDVSIPVLRQEILNLPLDTRNTMNLAAIAPGIRTYATIGGRSLPSAGAVPDLRFINLYVDGSEWKSLFNGNIVGIPQTGSPLPPEALQEFRVYLNSYDAEYARGGAYIISAITQRGTNALEGSAFLYYQNKALQDINDYQRQLRAQGTFKRPDFYNRQQVGLNLRGPIVRDRLFFALNYELGRTINAVEVSPGRPAYNPDLWRAYAGWFPSPFYNHTGVLRLTYLLNGRHTLDATWASRYHENESFFGGTVARDAGLRARYFINSVQLRNTWIPRADFMNELTLHFLSWYHNESPLVPGPTLQYPSLLVRGRNNLFPLVILEQYFRLTNKATYVAQHSSGQHTLKAGLELTRVVSEPYRTAFRDGFFVFATDTSRLPRQATIAVGYTDPNSDVDARVRQSGWVVGAYLNDQWQPTPRLILNVGLRYDADIHTLNQRFRAPWAQDPELLSKIPEYLNTGDRKNDLDNFSPRLSLSWDALGTGRTFLRGGFGVMYDRVPNFMAFNEKQAATWRTYTFLNPGTLDVAVLRQRVLQGQAPAGTLSITVIKDRMRTPEIWQYSIGLGHQLSPELALNVDYTDQRARNLYVQLNLNPLKPSTRTRRLTSRYGDILAWDDFGRARYRAFIASLTYQSRPVRLNLAYTLGWAQADFDGVTPPAYPERSSYRLQRLAGEERHRLVLSGIGRLPYGFQLSGIVILASPRPFGVIDGRDLNDNNTTVDDWPDGVRTMMPPAEWAYWYRTVDLRLSWSRPYRGARLTLSAEVFNLFNWTNYSGFFGTRYDQRGNPLANFGQPNGTFAPRQGQLGLRVEF